MGAFEDWIQQNAIAAICIFVALIMFVSLCLFCFCFWCCGCMNCSAHRLDKVLECPFHENDTASEEDSGSLSRKSTKKTKLAPAKGGAKKSPGKNKKSKRKKSNKKKTKKKK